MKRGINILLFLFLLCNGIHPQLLKSSGVNYADTYVFDKCNNFKILFYAKNNELMKTAVYKTYYQSKGDNFDIKSMPDKNYSGTETVIDKSNEVAIQIYGAGLMDTQIYYNAGGFKYPAEKDLKKLDITPTNETKVIAGITCKKYTYTFKKIFGEVWITEKINLPNDLGVFRAARMQAKHNTLSVSGFVMEMTTEDAGGGKTLMTTVSLSNAEKYTVNLKGVDMHKAINKINYYTF